MQFAVVMFRIVLILLIIGLSMPLSGQELKGVDLDSVDQLMIEEERPIAIFMHTSWCKFCKHMEASTFENSEVITLLNDKFYFARLDGEVQESINFMGKDFPPDQKSHTLVRALSDPEKGVSYPTFVLLNPNMEITFRHEGYLSKNDLKQVLVKTLEYSVDD